ncbi:MAG: O-antigen ligase family protein [Candidatus Buchananbacteria bacterium]
MSIFFYFLLSLFFILFAWLAKKSWLTAVGLLCLFLPSFEIRFQLWLLPSTVLELMLIIILGWWLIEIWQQKRYRQVFLANPLFWPALFLLLSATLALLPAPDLRSALGYWKAYFLEPILLFFALADRLTDYKKIQKFLVWLGAGALLIASVGIYQKFTGWLLPAGEWFNPETRRVTAFFTSPNAVTLATVPTALLYLGWLIQRWQTKYFWQTKLEKFYTVWQVIVIIAIITVSIFARSRGAWFAGLVAVIFILFFGWSKKYTSYLTTLGLLSLTLWPKIYQAIVNLLSFKVVSGTIRLNIYEQTLAWLKLNWLTGLGLGGFEYYYLQLTQRGEKIAYLYPHNILLNFWVELGFLGLLASLYLLSKFFIQGFKTLKISSAYWLLLGVLAAMVEIIAHGLVDVPYFKNDLAIIFWLVPALLVILVKNPSLILNHKPVKL